MSASAYREAHAAQSLLPTGNAEDLAAASYTASTYRFENKVAVVEHH